MLKGLSATIALITIHTLCTLSLVSCSSNGGGPAPARIAADFELAVDQGTFIDNAEADFSLDIRTIPSGKEVVIRATGANGLKAFYGDLHFNHEQWNPVEVTHKLEADSESELLTLEVLSDPGVVHIGQVIANWPVHDGIVGDLDVATILFRPGPSAANRTAAGVPNTDLSRTDLNWDAENLELSWRYNQQGDYNQDGFVTLNDLTPLGVNYGAEGPFDPVSAVSCVDGNADGFITVNDITPIGSNYGNLVTGYQVYINPNDDYPDTNTGGNGSAYRAGWVELKAAQHPENERLLFTYTLADPAPTGWFRVRPSNGIDEGTPSTIATSLPFDILVAADVHAGIAPFLVNLSAEPVAHTGTEPITYTWEVYDDTSPEDENPTIGVAPALDPSANITPFFCTAQNPTLLFGSPTDADEDTAYAVRCSAVDATGTEVTSQLLRVTVSPDASGAYYYSEQPQVTGELAFLDDLAHETANPVYVTLPMPEIWAPRANPAVCTHPGGMSFIIGGEHLAEDGSFEGLVERGDAVYAYLPRTSGTGTNDAGIGKLDTYEDRGYLIRLNDETAPGFPGSPRTPFSPQWPSPGGDTKVPQQLDPEHMPAQPPVVSTLRSAPFTIVGSAAAVMVHERPETNPAGAYPDRGINAMDFPPYVDDRDYQGMPEDRLWAWPDSALEGWFQNTAVSGYQSGTGVPAIYVFGGRVSATGPVDLVQKYYPWGFGTEDLPPWSQTYNFQTTCNQTNIWSPYFLRPDTDQFPGDNENFDPVIEDRGPEGEPGAEQYLPHLPAALYGLMATKIESGVETPYPVFPNGPYSYIYLFGGVDAAGAVSAEARIWDHSVPATPDSEDVILRLPDMPTPRAYGQAIFLPGLDLRIALVGGFGADGSPVTTVDIYNFDDRYNPDGGTWETFTGSLPEALSACGAGYFTDGTEEQLLVFGTIPADEAQETALSTNPYWMDIPTGGSQILPLHYLLAPRTSAGFGQSGSVVLSDIRAANMLGPVTYNRYYLFGGIGTEGMTNTVEVFGMPTAE